MIRALAGAEIIFMFSNADPFVRSEFARPSTLTDLVAKMHLLPQPVLSKMLRSIMNAAMIPSTRDLLEQAGIIPPLVGMLASKEEENVTHAITALYYLCEIKQSRREQAVRAGIIPHLQRFILSAHPGTSVAYTILFSLAKGSHETRRELKKHGGVQFYVDLLKNPHWPVQGADALASWMEADTALVDFELQKPGNTAKLFAVLDALSNAIQIESVLVHFFNPLYFLSLLWQPPWPCAD